MYFHKNLTDSCAMRAKNKRLRMKTQKIKQKKFFKLAEEFRRNENPREVGRLGEKLGKMVFGE